VAHTPPQPHRSAVRPEEVDAYDRVVARQKAYDYGAFLQLVPAEHRNAFADAAGLADSGAECDPADRIQPYMGAMLNSPLFMDLISELGVVARTRGEHPDSYSHADREWVDMVLCEELGAWGVYYGHIWDAVAVGVRPEAIKALRQGRDEDLTREELQLARYIRQVLRGTVTGDSYRAIERRLGRRGAVEYTALITFLIMTIRNMQAFGTQDAIPRDFVDDLIDRVIAGSVELPDAKARIPQLEPRP
jgi:hypothetical protein